MPLPCGKCSDGARRMHETDDNASFVNWRSPATPPTESKLPAPTLPRLRVQSTHVRCHLVDASPLHRRERGHKTCGKTSLAARRQPGGRPSQPASAFIHSFIQSIIQTNKQAGPSEPERHMAALLVAPAQPRPRLSRRNPFRPRTVRMRVRWFCLLTQPKRLGPVCWQTLTAILSYRQRGSCHDRARSLRPAALRLSCKWRVQAQVLLLAGARLPAQATGAPLLESLSSKITGSRLLAESVGTQSQIARGGSLGWVWTTGVEARAARAGSAPWLNGKRTHDSSVTSSPAATSSVCRAARVRQVDGHVCTNCPRACQ